MNGTLVLTIFYLETWLYYIPFTYTITGLGNKLMTFFNAAPQDNCLQRTYSIKSCTTLYNNKKIQGNFFFVKLVVSIYVDMYFMFIVLGQEMNMAFHI